MWSILYTAPDDSAGKIYNIGPFKTEKTAMKAAKKAQKSKEFDIHDQNVYLMSPKHTMTEFSISDLVAE